MKLLERAKNSNPRHGDALSELARAYWGKGLVSQAAENAQAAVKADPKNRPAHYLLAQIAQKAGDKETAQREFAIAQSLSKAESEHDIVRLAQLSRTSVK